MSLISFVIFFHQLDNYYYSHIAFQRLKYLESKFGRHQLTPPRSFDITSDIMISVNEGSPGFGILGQRSHVRFDVFLFY